MNQRVKLVLGIAHSSIEVDGMDLSDVAGSVEVRQKAGDVARVTVSMPMHQTMIEGEAVLLLDALAVETLRCYGFVPPADAQYRDGGAVVLRLRK